MRRYVFSFLVGLAAVLDFVLIVLAVHVVGLLLSAGPAAADKPVDDFEIGAFASLTPGPYIQEDVALGTPHVHAICDTRTVILDTTVGSAGASLVPGSALDDRAVVTLSWDGYCQFVYEWEDPIDLSQNGANDRVTVELGAGIAGGVVSVGIVSEGVGEGVSRTLLWAGPQTLVFPLDNFYVADPEQALAISVRFTTPAFATAQYLVEDIRLTSGSNLPVDYLGDFVAVQTPPIPTPPLTFGMLTNPGQPLCNMEIPILEVRDVTGLVPAVLGTWEDTPGLGGEIGAIFLQRAGIEPTPFLQSTFRMGIDPTPFAGQFPTIGFPPDPVVGDRSFLVEFPIVVTDAGGTLQGTSSVRLLADVHEGTPLKFGAVFVTPTEGGLRGGSVGGLELVFTVLPTGPVAPGAKLLDVTWIADWTPEGVTGVAFDGAPPEGSLRLVAAPSVTRAGTTLRASRPFDPGSALEIYDVAGRAIRRIRGIGGARTVYWDGDGDSGETPASGVYFARVAGEASSAARIVKIR